jgi:hypothetical protein
MTRVPPFISGSQNSHTEPSKLKELRCSTRSSGRMPNVRVIHRMWLTRLRCSTATPFGTPLEPDV